MSGNDLSSPVRTIFGAKVLNFCVRYGNRCIHFAIITRHLSKLDKFFFARLSPRSISTGQLNTSLCLHSQPINLIVFEGSYYLGNLILRGASRLDAFSVYPFHT